jgi:cytochrome c biogenesis protein CcmG/thiol:disulfide interchange protein DsbE
MPTTLRSCRALSRRSLLAGAPALGLTACIGGGDGVVPDIALPALPGLRTHTGWAMGGFDPGLFRNKVALLNVWASWCGYCRAEHPLLKALESRLGAPLYGLAYLDKPEAAAAYLRQAGNPFRLAAHDAEGRIARAVGQRGVPSTYVIGHDGKVAAKWGGGLSDEGIERVLRPGVRAARERMAAAARVG